MVYCLVWLWVCCAIGFGFRRWLLWRCGFLDLVLAAGRLGDYCGGFWVSLDF